MLEGEGIDAFTTEIKLQDALLKKPYPRLHN